VDGVTFRESDGNNLEIMISSQSSKRNTETATHSSLRELDLLRVSDRGE
jgi:hypothetical protein